MRGATVMSCLPEFHLIVPGPDLIISAAEIQWDYYGERAHKYDEIRKHDYDRPVSILKTTTRICRVHDDPAQSAGG
jgi:hypothetical protein